MKSRNNLQMSLQQLIEQKRTLLEQKKKFFDKVDTQHHGLYYHLENAIEEFEIYWRQLIVIVNSILNFCYRHRIVLKYMSTTTSVVDWYRLHDRQHRSYLTLMYLFEKYLVSDLIENLPESVYLREFSSYHREAIHKFEDLLTLV